MDKAPIRNRNRKLEISTAPTVAGTSLFAGAYPKQNRVRSRESGRQAIKRLWWMVFGVETKGVHPSEPMKHFSIFQNNMFIKAYSRVEPEHDRQVGYKCDFLLKVIIYGV